MKDARANHIGGIQYYTDRLLQMSIVTTHESSDLVSVVGGPARSVVVLLVVLLAILAVLVILAVITILLPGVDVDDLDKQLANELVILLIVRVC